MATPLTAAAFLKALKDEGVTVKEVGSWRTHNRNSKGPWGPVNGVMIHHTVTSGTQSSIDICRNGYPSLPGPLCHGVIDKEGVVHLVGYGRANHAGLGDDDVLRAVIAETAPLPDNEANTDGNRHFYGFECINLGDGRDPWPEEQIEAIVRTIAALCRAHGWSARSALRHLDWQPGKVDPRGPGMNWTDVLARAAQRLGSKPPAKLPRPKKPTVSLSRLVAAAKHDPPAKGAPVTYSGTRIVEAALVDEGLLAKKYLDGHYGTTTKTAMSEWQERCGYHGRQPGQDADGIPGKTTLTKLGRKHGFDVKD
ncbi:N-acetylmuramoyl-L-alanine amidase [Streptomyces sp. DASNCL29]|uniref:N-acetylmuramoyl-L-alanine amidase n=1 Tax=Streptomyces sp. DASNCL29 TaxID=2583819 RepID=UPI00110F81DB|nr:N-acetylmuramoyl-L-alanine amidase [Streptomyces sp. DASNCL29]TMU98106.1 N-acetylmuramoyl-L-alanine amidase [Streptomyces sp. DASNCL29]